MKWLRRILSHGLLISVVIAGSVIVYWNRDQLFSTDHARLAANPVPNELPALAAGSPLAQPVGADELSESQAKNIEDTENPLIDDDPARIALRPLTASATTSEGSVQKPYGELLMQARQAYWDQDIVSAKKYYQKIVANYPDNPDLMGELANVYFAQGQWDSAVNLYYKASIALINAGEHGRVREMITALHGMDASKAEQLGQQLLGYRYGQ